MHALLPIQVALKAIIMADLRVNCPQRSERNTECGFRIADLTGNLFQSEIHIPQSEIRFPLLANLILDQN
jgi:hypothetical protein